MMKHSSMCKFKEGVSPELIGEIITEFLKLPAKIPEIKSMIIGRDIGDRDYNYDVAWIMDFDSFETYKIYRANDDHMAFVHKYLLPNIAAKISVQFDAP